MYAVHAIQSSRFCECDTFGKKKGCHAHKFLFAVQTLSTPHGHMLLRATNVRLWTGLGACLILLLNQE